MPFAKEIYIPADSPFMENSDQIWLRRLAIAMALGAMLTITLLALMPRSQVAGGEAREGRAVTAAQVALADTQQRLESSLRQLANDLRPSIEELDRDAVARRLNAFCASEHLTACQAYGLDFESLVRGRTLPAGERQTATQLAAGETLISLQAVGNTALGIVGIVPIHDDVERLGFVRLTIAFGDEFSRRLSLLSGSPVALAASGRVVAPPSMGRQDLLRGTSRLVPGWHLDGQDLQVLIPPQVEDGFTLPFNPRALALGILFTLLFIIVALGSSLHRTNRSLLQFGQSLEALVGDPIDGSLPSSAPGPTAAAARALAALVSKYRERLAQVTDHAIASDRRLKSMEDLVAVDAGAFHIFQDKAAQLVSICAQEIHAMQAATAPISEATLREHLAIILRHVYTLRDHAQLFSMERVRIAACEFEEHLVASLRSATPSQATHRLLALRLATVEQELRSYRELRQRLLGDDRLVTELGQRLEVQGQWLLSLVGRSLALIEEPVLNVEDVARICGEYQHAAMCVGGEDLADYVQRFNHMLQERARKSKKQLAPVRLTGNRRFLPPELFRHLYGALLHGLHNALDHGVERPTERQSAGKSKTGHIQVDCNVVDGMCTLTIRDDGRGLSPESLRAHAVKSGIMTREAAAALTDGEAQDLAFVTGLSTVNANGALSGRGIGMGVVREAGDRLAGSVQLESKSGQGTAVHVHFPLRESRFGTRQTIFNLGGELDAIVHFLGSSLSGVDLSLTVNGAPHRFIMLADRILFDCALRELITAIAIHAPRPGRIELQLSVTGTPDAGGFTTASLEIAIRDEHGTLNLEIPRALERALSTRLRDLLLEAGIAVTSGGKGGATLSLAILGCAGDILANQRLVVFCGTPDTAPIKERLREIHQGRLAGFRIDCFDQSTITAFEDACANATGIILLDENSVRDDPLRARLADHIDNVVIAVPSLTSLNPGAPARWTPEPLILIGPLDTASLQHALAVSCLRVLRNRREEAALPRAIAA